uniref:Uncharacterized protein n=1 Tax=viral metagenome TaxID=1070528 RepID=A0A6C0ADI3_9ZZZZ
MDRPVKYTFVPKQRNIISNDNIKLKPVRFYQIATYKNNNNLYHVRRITFDGNNSITEVKNAFFKKYKLEEFIESKRDNLYNTYPVYSLDTIPYPTASDISLARSDILQYDHDYTGYSPYYCN